MRFRFPTFLSIACLLSALPSHAQDYPQVISSDLPAPAHVAYVEGRVILDRENESDAAALGVPLVEGDRLRTEQGRAEVLFPDGTALDVDEFSTIELQSPTLLRLSQGRALLIVTGAADPQSAADFHIDTPVAGIDTYGPGEYRLSLLNGRMGPEAELAVVRGAAAITGDRGSLELRPGERSSTIAGGTPSSPQTFNSARFDAFDRWVDLRRDDRRGVRSAQYLPQDLRMYSGMFDRDGSWAYESQYGGYVWYPTVAPDWRPYYDGYWSPTPRYGWIWVGGVRWSWPTHHYGRWGLNGARWFWIPDRRWGAAWVSWADAPGYVSWCPLGFDNRPLFSLSVSFGSRRNGWVVVPRDHFGSRRYSVRQWALPPDRFPRTTFVARASSPIAAPRYNARADYATAGRRPRPGERQWEPRPNASRGGGIFRTTPRDGNATIYTNRPQGSGAPRVAVPRQSDPGSSPRYTIRGRNDRGTPDIGVRRGDRTNDSAVVGSIPSTTSPSQHTPTIGSVPGPGRRPRESDASPYRAPSTRTGEPVSPVYAPPPNAAPGETLPSYRRREAPQYSVPSAPNAAAEPRTERPRYRRNDTVGDRQPGTGDRPQSDGGRRAVPPERSAERPSGPATSAPPNDRGGQSRAGRRGR